MVRMDKIPNYSQLEPKINICILKHEKFVGVADITKT